MWNRHPSTNRKKTWMNDATCRISTRSLQKAKRIYHGLKIGVTNLEAGLPIEYCGPCFGATKHTQELLNTGSKCATAAASWQQHISVILRGYMPEKLTLPLIGDPVLEPWAYLGFDKKGPQCLNKKTLIHEVSIAMTWTWNYYCKHIRKNY